MAELGTNLPWVESGHPWYNVAETVRHAIAAYEVGDIEQCRELILQSKDRLDEMLPYTDWDEIQKAMDSELGDGYFTRHA